MAATALGVAAGLVWVDGSGGALAVGPPTVPGSSCPTFLPDSVWNTPVSNLPVNARSGDWLAASGATAGRKLHPDFGGPPYGMPINVVHSSHATTTFKFDYADESDPGPYPYGSDLQIEQGGDAHLLTVNQDTCRLYEVYATNNNGPGTAGSGAIWDLRSHALRRDGATSSDAAGLPVFPGLVRRDEVAAGAIRHAIRFSVQHTDRSHVWPARHDAGSASDPALPPMGARFRLKSSFDASSYGPEARVVLTAMQNYGLILADNGSNWFFQGTMDPGWNDPQYDTMISQLKTIPASAFEAVDESSLMVDPNSDQARQSPGGPVPSTPTPVPARSTPTPSAVAPSPTATPESTPTPGKVPGSPTPTPARPNKPPRQGPGCWPIWAPPPVH
jgi:cell division septation protein DedD